MTTLNAIKALGVNTATLTRHATRADADRMAASYTAGPIRLVVLGCDGRFWVVSAKDAGRLTKAGYELA